MLARLALDDIFEGEGSARLRQASPENDDKHEHDLKGQRG